MPIKATESKHKNSNSSTIQDQQISLKMEKNTIFLIWNDFYSYFDWPLWKSILDAIQNHNPENSLNTKTQKNFLE